VSRGEVHSQAQEMLAQGYTAMLVPAIKPVEFVLPKAATGELSGPAI